ncbi:MAG: hypothetical protein F4X98_08310 [Gammaproteobacteria bacterium]|nr:hypothetical protein [Gammaproteobacteria bacterium]
MRLFGFAKRKPSPGRTAYEAGEQGRDFPAELVGHPGETDLRELYNVGYSRWLAGSEFHKQTVPAPQVR